MADKGFDIAYLLSCKSATMNISRPVPTTDSYRME